MTDRYPVDAVIPNLSRILAGTGRAVLTASPGSGKTTRVPLALLGLLPITGKQYPTIVPLSGKILVLEPRRLAARTAARYMAHLLGEDVGQHVGYSVRLESKLSKMTRVELLTEGMFTRRLLTDPELSGVSCVIFDEFHERSLQADLGLALCLESAAALRPDLRLLVMSATLETEELSRYLGKCPIIEAKGSNWPVEVRYTRQETAVSPASSLGDLAGKITLAVREALASQPGSILVFLPGQTEIRHVAELLTTRPKNTDVYPLYGNLPLHEQDAAITPSPLGRRKVVLATDLAQTSLTIEGIRIVIDAGLARSPHFEPATGLSRLVTTRIAQDAASQRTGRAGRLEPGLCLRLWFEKEALIPQTRPEIMDADLTSLYLDTLAWGSEPASLPWLTPPPESALQNAAETLIALGAVRYSTGNRLTLTPHGEKLSRLPLHPRLAHMVLRAAELKTDISSLAACLAALISERDPLRKNTAGEIYADIRLRLPLLKRPENKHLRDVAEQIHRLSGLKDVFRLPDPHEEDFSGMLLSLAWPERIAQRRMTGSFRLSSGQGAELSSYDPLASEPWLATASLGGGTNRRIYLAAPITQADLLRLHGEETCIEDDVYWDSRSETVVCRSSRKFGALVLEEKPLPPSPELSTRIKKAMLEGIVSMGVGCLPWTEEIRQLQARVIMLHGLGQTEAQKENAWPDMTDATLLAGLTENPETTWLSPWLEGVTRRSQLASVDFSAALRALLPWPLPERLEENAPKRLDLPSGSSAQLDYLPVLRGEPPILAVKLQEMFGQTATPRVANGRITVMLHLLSPAGRPLQVTGDLRHFWGNAYKLVRAEMRGRYPKHPWPEDPLNAQPTGKTKKRFETTLKN